MSEVAGQLQEQDFNTIKIFFAECRQHAASLGGEINHAMSLLEAVEEHSDGFHQRALARMEGLRHTIIDIRGEWQNQASRIEEESGRMIAQLQGVQQELQARLAQAAANLGSVRGRLDSCIDAVDGGVESLNKRSMRLGETIRSLVEGVEDRKSEIESVVDKRLYEDTEKHAQRTMEEIGQFLESLGEGVQRVFVDAVSQQHAQMNEHYDYFHCHLDLIQQRLEASASLTLDTFQQRQTEQIERLTDGISRTRQAVEAALEAFKTSTANFASVAENVTGAMKETQIGFKVTAGALEKVKNVLEGIRL